MGPPGMGMPGPPGQQMQGPPGMHPPGMHPPGMQQQGMQQQGMQQQQQQRIDPASIPRPVISTTPGTALYETRVAGQASNPPSAASRYVVRDRGNAGPRYLRCTMNQVRV